MPAVSLNRFVEALSESTVLAGEQAEQLPELHQSCDDSRARARELILGPYVLLERIGEGGMGQVFKARQRSLHRLVALKVIRPECLANQRVIRRFLREIHVASQLTH